MVFNLGFNRLSWSQLVVAAVASLATVCQGCGGQSHDAPPRTVVFGKITFSGTPVSDGTIRFVPNVESNLPIAFANIIDGQYRVDNKGGVPKGECRVEIMGYRPEGPMGDGGLAPMKQYVSRKYNTDSELVVVVDGREMEFDFDLTP